MIYIYHGDDIVLSKKELLSNSTSPIIYDAKNTNIFLSDLLLFNKKQDVVIMNFFSIGLNLQSILLAQIKLIDKTCKVHLWESKKISQSLSTTFPSAKIFFFKKDNTLYKCLNSIKANNFNQFKIMYEKVISENQFDLFLYLSRKEIRKKVSYTNYKKVYIKLIELDFLNKSGILNITKEIALYRTLSTLVK